MMGTSQLRPGPRHTWSDKDTILLSLLYRLYSNDKPSLLRIFNHINRDILIGEGLASGSMPLTALNSQVSDMKRKKHPVWVRITHTPNEVLRRKYRVQKDRIEDSGQALGIELKLTAERIVRPQPQLQSTPLPALSPHNLRHTSSSTRGPVTREDWSVSIEPEAAQRDSPSAPGRLVARGQDFIRSFAYDPNGSTSASAGVQKPNCDAQSASPKASIKPHHLRFEGVFIPQYTRPAPLVALPRTPSPAESDYPVRSIPRMKRDAHSGGDHGRREHPLLLFRAHDPTHGFKARRFQRGTVIPTPPLDKSEDFKAEVRSHLCFDTKFISPLISTTDLASKALGIIKQSEEPKEFAVFLFDHLFEEGWRRNRIHPQLVYSLKNKYNLDDLPNNYRGRGEWLVWGMIESTPLLNLSHRKVKELQDVLDNSSGCNDETALKLRPFIENVDFDYQHHILRALMLSIHDEDAQKRYNSRKYLRFQAIACGDYQITPDPQSVEEWPSGTHSQSDSAQESDLEQQRAVDRQLLCGIQDYLSDDDLNAIETTPSSHPFSIANNPTNNEDDGRTADTVATPNETLQNSVPVPSIESGGTSSSPEASASPVIDLADDSNSITEPVQGTADADIDMFDVLDDEDDCVLIRAVPLIASRSLSIRSRPRRAPQVTPTRPSRYPEYHVMVLSDSE